MSRVGGRAARRGVAVLLLVAAVPAVLQGQSAYPAANGQSSIVPRSTGFARADFAEANLSLYVVHEILDPGIGLEGWAGAAARAGQVDMFGAFDFNPGFEGGVLAFKSLGGGARSLDVVALSVGYQSTQRKLAAFDPDSTRITLSEETQRDVTAGLSLNLALGPRVMTGLGGAVRREWSSPGTAPSAEVCVETTSPGGVIIPLCGSRYLVPLEDYWAGQLRADVLWAFLGLGGAQSQPHLALIGAGSIDVGQGAPARWNIAGGVGVVPLEYPGQIIVTLLVGVYDLSDAGDRGLDVGDRLVTRLVLGIPFALLAD